MIGFHRGKIIFLVGFLLAVSPAWAASEYKLPSFKDIDQVMQNTHEVFDESHIKKRLPHSQQRDARLFWQGYLDYEKDFLISAEKKLKKIRSKSWLKNYADFFLAQIAFRNRDYKQVIEILPDVSNPSKQIEWDAFWLRVQAYAYLQKEPELNQQFKKLSKKSLKDRFVQIQKHYALGIFYFFQNKKSQAYKSFAVVLVKHPGSEFDAQIFDFLKTQRVKLKEVLPRSLQLLRAENLIQNGLADWGYAIYEDLATSKQSFLEQKAMALFRGRRYVEAAELFEKLLERGNSEMTRYQILVRLGQCYTRTDQFEKAIANHEQVQREFPGVSSAKNQAFQKAFLYYDSKQFEKAVQEFKKFLPDHRGGVYYKTSRQQLAKARWYTFWSYYLTNQWQNAEREALQGLKEIKKDKEKIQAYTYFLARIYEKRGQKSAAKKQYEKLLALDEFDYYRLLAQHRLKHGKLNAKALIDSDILQSVPKVQGNAFENEFEKQILEQPNLGRAFVLSRVGLNDYAFDEISFVQEQVKTDSSLVLSLQDLGNSRLSFAIGYAAKAGRIEGCDSRCAFYLRFPLAYKHYVEPYSKLWQGESSLAYAIMRQESAFHPSVVSSAFAYGLMQVIPPTGQEIANAIDFPNFDPMSLKNPKINTLFGTYYLKTLNLEFLGELVPTIAAYNAGPYNVGRWIKKDIHKEWDEFIELIPYSQTKDYTKRVLVNYWIYSKLYE